MGNFWEQLFFKTALCLTILAGLHGFGIDKIIIQALVSAVFAIAA